MARLRYQGSHPAGRASRHDRRPRDIYYLYLDDQNRPFADHVAALPFESLGSTYASSYHEAIVVAVRRMKERRSTWNRGI